jgi:ABC-2 type transport system ATP-binding protein
MHRPRVLFLDEPSTGLDPQARLFVHERVSELHEDGVTVVLTTHDMDEAAKLCDRVGIVDHGKLLALDTPDALTRNLPGRATLLIGVRLAGVAPERIVKELGELAGVERVEPLAGGPAGPRASAPVAPPEHGRFRLNTAEEAATTLPAVLSALGALGCEVEDISIGRPSLEDVFIHLTGRELR